MERIEDKAVVLACCLAVVGCELSSTGMQGAEASLPFATAMLAALGCTLVPEAFPRRRAFAAPCAYCLAALAFPAAAAFAPLAMYDLARLAHDPGASRLLVALAPAAFLACAARGALCPLAAGVLACAMATACLLSARTNRAMARQTIARLTRDSMESQAISLRQRNETLETEVRALHEKQGCAADENDGPESARPAAFACLTEREYEVARLVAEGMDNREIAGAAYLSEGTVRNNISSILSKMNLRNRTQIAVAFYKETR